MSHLAIRVTPRSSKPGIGGWRTGADGRDELELRVAEAPADGAATLARFTAECVAMAGGFFSARPARWIACGGGRRNAYLLTTLLEVLGENVAVAEDAGWDGDALEAQAFAYLAARHLEGLPLSFPSTTGVRHPMPGGQLHSPK